MSSFKKCLSHGIFTQIEHLYFHTNRTVTKNIFKLFFLFFNFYDMKHFLIHLMNSGFLNVCLVFSVSVLIEDRGNLEEVDSFL